MVIYPDYPDDGGLDSERTLVKQVVQKYISTETNNNLYTATANTPDGSTPF
jgi:hypothetical protein